MNLKKNTSIKMKVGRPAKLTQEQKEEIWKRYKEGNIILAKQFGVSTSTIRRTKKIKGLQNKKYAGGDPEVQARKKALEERRKLRERQRRKRNPELDRYTKLSMLSKQKGCRTVTEAISKFGKQNLLNELR